MQAVRAPEPAPEEEGRREGGASRTLSLARSPLVRSLPLCPPCLEDGRESSKADDSWLWASCRSDGPVPSRLKECASSSSLSSGADARPRLGRLRASLALRGRRPALQELTVSVLLAPALPTSRRVHLLALPLPRSSHPSLDPRRPPIARHAPDARGRLLVRLARPAPLAPARVAPRLARRAPLTLFVGGRRPARRRTGVGGQSDACRRGARRRRL